MLDKGHTLKRHVFSTSGLLEFTSEKELELQTGRRIPRVVSRAIEIRSRYARTASPQATDKQKEAAEAVFFAHALELVKLAGILLDDAHSS